MSLLFPKVIKLSRHRAAFRNFPITCRELTVRRGSGYVTVIIMCAGFCTVGRHVQLAFKSLLVVVHRRY